MSIFGAMMRARMCVHHVHLLHDFQTWHNPSPKLSAALAKVPNVSKDSYFVHSRKIDPRRAKLDLILCACIGWRFISWATGTSWLNCFCAIKFQRSQSIRKTNNETNRINWGEQSISSRILIVIDLHNLVDSQVRRFHPQVGPLVLTGVTRLYKPLIGW